MGNAKRVLLGKLSREEAKALMAAVEFHNPAGEKAGQEVEDLLEDRYGNLHEKAGRIHRAGKSERTALEN